MDDQLTKAAATEKSPAAPSEGLPPAPRPGWADSVTTPQTHPGFEGRTVAVGPPDLSIGSLLSSAWRTLTGNWGLLGVMLLGILATLVSVGLLLPAVLVATNAAALRAVRGQSYDQNSLTNLGFKRYLPMLVLTVAVFAVSFVLNFVPFVGFVASIGIGMVFNFLPFIVADTEGDLSAILQRTRQLLEPHLVQILLVMIATYFISFGLTITVIGIAIALPLLPLVYAEAYDRMRSSVDSAASQARMVASE